MKEGIKDEQLIILDEYKIEIKNETPIKNDKLASIETFNNETITILDSPSSNLNFINSSAK